MGYAACQSARADIADQGNVGAGAGATVGKVLGMAIGAPDRSFPERELEDGGYCREFIPCPEQPDLTSKRCWGNLSAATCSFAKDIPDPEDDGGDPGDHETERGGP